MNCPRCDNSTFYQHLSIRVDSDGNPKEAPLLLAITCPKCNLSVYDRCMGGYTTDIWNKIETFKKMAQDQETAIPLNFWHEMGISLYYIDGHGTKDYDWRQYAGECQRDIPEEDIDKDPGQALPSERDIPLDPRGGEVDGDTDDICEDGGVQSEVPILRHSTPEGDGNNPEDDIKGGKEISL